MFGISRQQACQKFIFKIHSSRLKKAGWNLTLPISEARRNDEVISLADSQILRWIDSINGLDNLDMEARRIKSEIKAVRKEPSSASNRRKIRSLYEDLDKIQFKPDYMCLIVDSNSDYYRASDGFTINSVRYKRLLGTNGGIKNSTIVFVNENMSEELKRRIDNGRDLNKELITAKLEAYQALTCSASIPVSFPKGIAVVKDCEVSFTSEALCLDDEDSIEPNMVYSDNLLVSSNASDGFGIMLPSLAERWSKELRLDYTVSGLNTRFSFEKGMVFTFDFLDFADKEASGSYIVKDAWGDSVDLRDVELILTTSMVKLWDSYENCDSYIANSLGNGYTFGVAKTCPKELESERALNYQFIQSYDLTDDDIDELVSPTVEEIKDIISGDWTKMALFLRGSGIKAKNIIDSENDYSKALLIDHSVINDPFVRSSVYRLIKNRIDRAKVGVINVHGNYSIVSGDPFSLCQSIFNMPITGLLSAGEIYNKYWADTEAAELACFRAPMTCYNNVRKVIPNRSEKCSYWYKYMSTCTIFNSWDTAAIALNGMDFDGDLVMLSDNRVLVDNLVNTPALVCKQRKAEKRVSDERDFIRSNIASFGNDIGKTTNWITSMFEVRARYEVDSQEYEALTYRIRCGQLYQQNK